MVNSNALVGRKVLVVDDYEDMTSLLADVLAGAGARVTEANRGEDALLFLACCDFDVIFLDLTMPQPDGWSILQSVRDSRPDLLPRTIVLTANRYDRQVAERLEDLHVVSLFKPFLLTDLIARAHHVLRNHGNTGAAA